MKPSIEVSPTPVGFNIGRGWVINVDMSIYGIEYIVTTFIGLAEPFDVFAVALNYLSIYDDLSNPDDYLEILEELKELYSEQEIIKGVVYTAIFHTPVRGVRGYCAHITEEKLRIVFWGFDDLIENDISV